MRVAPLAAVLIALAATPAVAAPCYIIYDRNDAVVYRDYDPPFDLDNPKAPERAFMRRQGQHLMVAEFENCNPVGYISAVTGGTTASVDEIVMQLKPAVGTSVTGTAAPMQINPGRQPYGTTNPPAKNPAAITVTTGGAAFTAR
jgi:hypothetical protein